MSDYQVLEPSISAPSWTSSTRGDPGASVGPGPPRRALGSNRRYRFCVTSGFGWSPCSSGDTPVWSNSVAAAPPGDPERTTSYNTGIYDESADEPCPQPVAQNFLRKKNQEEDELEENGGRRKKSFKSKSRKKNPRKNIQFQTGGFHPLSVRR